MDQSSNLFLATVLTEATAGGVFGFLFAYGLRKVAGLLLKVLAIGVTLLIIPIGFLAHAGVLKVDFPALMQLLADTFNTVAQTVADTIPSLIQMAPVSGGFAVGLFAGVMKK